MSAAPSLSILLVDDEPLARKRLRRLLEDLAHALPTHVLGEAANGAEVLTWLDEHRSLPQVLLLDIAMPEMSGIELARHLLRLPNPPTVVFVTAYDDYAVQAFDVQAVDYLLKPVKAERLLAALQKARKLRPVDDSMLHQLQPQGRKHLVVHERGRLLLVPLAEVLYLKAELKYITVRTVAREYLIEESLTQLEQEFGPRFVRIHRNCLVAKDMLAGFERAGAGGEDGQWQVVLHGVPERLLVSRRQQHLVRELANK